MAKNTRTTRTALASVEHIARSILVLRGHRVIVDRDLAVIYGVSTGRLNEAVKRNAQRFPEDFMFQLTAQESEHLRSHFAISSWAAAATVPTFSPSTALTSAWNAERALAPKTYPLPWVAGRASGVSQHRDPWDTGHAPFPRQTGERRAARF